MVIPEVAIVIGYRATATEGCDSDGCMSIKVWIVAGGKAGKQQPAYLESCPRATTPGTIAGKLSA
jgi:hypothetical protein